jgi:hypothetical protein
MADFEYKTLPISALRLDTGNPRHEVQADELAEVKEFLAQQGSKIVRLIRDIAATGTNPAELPIVIPDDADPQKFIVLEGNRRLLSLRLLSDPGLAELAGKPSIKRTLEQVAKQRAVTLDTLQCVVFRNRDEAAHWIELRHTGANDGIGIVGWDPTQVARFKKTQYETALLVVDHVRENVPMDEELKRQISRIYLSTVARLINDPDIRNACCLKIENGKLSADVALADLDKALLRIVSDVATKQIKVDDVKSKADRLRYLERLSKEGIIPPATAQKVDPYPVGGVHTATHRKRGRPPSTSRRALIAPSCVLRIGHPRVNDVYKELKRLDVELFTNCAAAMLRVFLELSLNAFATRRITFKPRKGQKAIHLGDKILDVADYLENNGTLTRGELNPIRAMAKKKNDLFGVPTLNDYIHNPHFSPIAKDLKTMWDNMQSFMEALWP